MLAIVEGCTDSDTHHEQRKERYLAHLADVDASVLLVATADKLHNARSILIDLRRMGDEVWIRFNAGREGRSGSTLLRRCRPLEPAPSVGS